MFSTLWTIFLLLAIGLIGWSLWKYYGSQPTNQSQAKRVVGALWAGLMALAAWVTAFFATPPTTP